MQKSALIYLVPSKSQLVECAECCTRSATASVSAVPEKISPNKRSDFHPLPGHRARGWYLQERMGPEQQPMGSLKDSRPLTPGHFGRTGDVQYISPALSGVQSARTLSSSTLHGGSKKLSCCAFLRPVYPFRRRGPGRPQKPVDRPSCGRPTPQEAGFRVSFLVVKQCPKRIVAGRWRQSPALGHMQFIHSMLGSSSKQSGETSTSVPNNGTYTGGDVR